MGSGATLAHARINASRAPAEDNGICHYTSLISALSSHLFLNFCFFTAISNTIMGDRFCRDDRAAGYGMSLQDFLDANMFQAARHGAHARG